MDSGKTFGDSTTLHKPRPLSITLAIVLREGPFSANQRIGRLYLSVPKAPLVGNSARLSISIALRFRITQVAAGNDRWEIQTFAYSHLLFRDDREIIAYHWDHDGGAGVVRAPHVHIGKELPHPAMHPSDRDQLDVLASAHRPTGAVPLTAFLHTAIHDLGIEPIRWQGESVEDARIGVEQCFSETEAILMESFDWQRA